MTDQTSRRHKWDHEREQRLAGTDRLLSCNIKQCLVCRMKKITMIPPYGFPWHEWLTADGKTWVGETTPPCLPLGKNVVTA